MAAVRLRLIIRMGLARVLLLGVRLIPRGRVRLLAIRLAHPVRVLRLVLRLILRVLRRLAPRLRASLPPNT